MLIRALTEEFQRYFTQAAHHDTVLWFDPDREYAGLLDHLPAGLVWRYDGSLLQLRYRLTRRAPGEHTVVYLPMSEGDADLLRPFFATSLRFTDRLYRFLRRQGLAFPDDPNVAHKLRELLPQLAVRSVGNGREFWEYNLANLERAIDTLLGEFDGTLLRFLERPDAELAALRAQNFDGLFLAQLAGAYGVQAAADDNPQETARAVTAQFVLTRAFVDAGKPDGFPYAARLPQPHQFDRGLQFLERWQNDARYAPAYVRLAAEVERAYDLGRWLESRPVEEALELGATLPHVETASWERVQRLLAGLEGEAAWREWLVGHRAALAARAGGFWAEHGRDPGWGVLVQAADLLDYVQAMRQELADVCRPGEMLRRYAAGWWQVDAAYRAFRRLLAAAPGSLDLVRERCAHSYGQALRAMNERFSELLAAEPVWPPADGLAEQDRFWEQAIGRPPAGARTAVLFVDALRYELAQALLAELEADRAGDSRGLEARLAAIPTVTPLGMAALLPDGHLRQASHDGEWHVRIRDSGDLAAKAARVEWLAACLAGRSMAAYDLSDLLNTPAERIARADWLFVFDTTLDALGESASAQSWDAFEPLVRGVKQAVHKLLALGIDQVHVVADHGFLLLHEVAEHEKVTTRNVAATVKDRYLVGRGLGSTAQLTFRVPCSQDLEAWFPRGIGCFRTPGRYNYVHGGLSLQELVVPCLTVRQQQMGRPVGVRVDLPDVIRQAQMRLTLEPDAQTMLDQPRRVSLALEKGGRSVMPPFETTVLATGPAALDIWLPSGCGLEHGDRVEWVLRDRLTGEVLHRREAVSQVDLW